LIAQRLRPHRPGAHLTRTGRITVVQESRFRLVDDTGVGYLFTLGRFSRTDATQLARWLAAGARVTVAYSGLPDMGAVAHHVRVET